MAKKEKEKLEVKEEMTLEEARAFRASLHKPAKAAMGELERKEAFRVYWAKEKAKYGMGKDLEDILWLHLQAVKMDEPEKFEQGVKHFGLKKVD
jgi:hypothetical protein